MAKVTNELLCGASAGIFGTVLGYPFDTVKTRMQTRPTQYPSMKATFMRIYQEEGFVEGFYRGVGPPLAALTILNMMNFTLYTKFSELFRFQKEHRTLSRIEPKTFLAGSLVGVSAAVISTPFELIKIQMQLQTLLLSQTQSPSSSSSTGKKNGSYQLTKDIVSRYGPQRLYRGHLINTVREMIFLGTYFFVYEHSKHLLAPYCPLVLSIGISGGMSGAIGWMVSFPLDCIKANIQGSSIHSTPASSLSIASQLLKTKGLRGLYSGVGASVSRAFIVSSSRFIAYEFAQWLLASVE
jgi:solute carrier family 25 (mitochondrial carnitine/acylcarnitine transporter), member 20/29